MKMLPLLVSWALLATVVIGLAVYRKMVAGKEIVDVLRVDAVANSRQAMLAKKLEGIDKWGKLLTIIAAAYALVVLAVFFYNGWTNSNTSIFQ